MQTAACPECDADVNIPDNHRFGTRLECDECGTELEIDSIDPPTLAVVEDEDDEDDEDEDDGGY